MYAHEWILLCISGRLFFVFLICDGDGGGDGGSNAIGWRETGFGDIDYTFGED